MKNFNLCVSHFFLASLFFLPILNAQHPIHRCTVKCSQPGQFTKSTIITTKQGVQHGILVCQTSQHATFKKCNNTCTPPFHATCTVTKKNHYGGCGCQENQSSGQTTAQFTTNQEIFIPTGSSTDTFQNVPLTTSSFKSKVAKFHKGKIRIKRKGTYYVSALAHHASPTSLDFKESAELNHVITVNGAAIPASKSKTVWASTPNNGFRHKHTSHTRFTAYFKEKDDLELKITGSVQAGLTLQESGTSAMIIIEAVDSSKR